MECFHKASLIHDDIEDRDAMRYGGAESSFTSYRAGHGYLNVVLGCAFALSFLFNVRPQTPRTALDPVRDNLRLAKSVGANIEQPVS